MFQRTAGVLYNQIVKSVISLDPIRKPMIRFHQVKRTAVFIPIIEVSVCSAKTFIRQVSETDRAVGQLEIRNIFLPKLLIISQHPQPEEISFKLHKTAYGYKLQIPASKVIIQQRLVVSTWVLFVCNYTQSFNYKQTILLLQNLIGFNELIRHCQLHLIVGKFYYLSASSLFQCNIKAATHLLIK